MHLSANISQEAAALEQQKRVRSSKKYFSDLLEFMVASEAEEILELLGFLISLFPLQKQQKYLNFSDFLVAFSSGFFTTLHSFTCGQSNLEIVAGRLITILALFICKKMAKEEKSNSRQFPGGFLELSRPTQTRGDQQQHRQCWKMAKFCKQVKVKLIQIRCTKVKV